MSRYHPGDLPHLLPGQMSLIRFEQVSLEYGDRQILTDAGLAIERGERVCLIGRNGAGKSTTLRLMAGAIEPDRGAVVRQDGLVISQLDQSLPDSIEVTVRELVKNGLAGVQALLDEYGRRSSSRLDAVGLRELENLQRRIDAHEGWHLEQRVDRIMTELQLPPDQRIAELSGGWRRRSALARALVSRPDVLLLDEPTNHLDIATIEWLEAVVGGYPGAVVFVTHDRVFLDKLATRIVEIDRGRLTSWPGNFREFESRKEKALEAEARQDAVFDARLAQEEIWVRQGIKARRTRNEGRARALERMRIEHAGRVSRDATARITIEEAEQSGRQVIRARNVSYGYGSRPLIGNFSVRIMRGDRVGILGNNGVGKTTLLRLLLGELQPESGTIKRGVGLEVAWLDQLRDIPDPDRSVADVVGDGRSHVRIDGRDRHIIGYLKDFLFSAKRAGVPVKALSGGERNRVILARLFTRPANLLVLDEPTNDLDMETLEVLEQRLSDWTGTLLIVSHDRRFLDNVVTSTLAFESGGRIHEYVGGYADWAKHGVALAEMDTLVEAAKPARSRPNAPAEAGPGKLSYREQRELDRLPEEIEQLEAALRRIEGTISASDFYRRPHDEVRAVLDEMQGVRKQVDLAMERWTVLEDRQQAYLQSRR